MKNNDQQASKQASKVKPFVKWVGGKRQLLFELYKYLPKHFDTYYEPFVGGGALLFDLLPQKAVINDYNSQLINVYKVVENDPQKLIFELTKFKDQHNHEYYYHIRNLDRDSNFEQTDPIFQAARFIYLNKTGFNGLYRVNKNGQVNVPIGNYKNPTILDQETLLADSQFLKSSVKILNVDFEESVKDAEKGDLVYFDPPYYPVSKTSNFTSYTDNGFDESQQIRLHDVALKLVEKGVFVIISNSEVKEVKELYSEKVFKIHKVQAKRSINSQGANRGNVGEVIIVGNSNVV